MMDRLEETVLRLLRVPPPPEAPAGDPGSIRVFRASPTYFRYRLIGWGIGQVGTLIGLVFGLILGWSFVDDFFGSGLPALAVTALGLFAWFAYIVQIPLSFAALRLDYELRWYMLSDRALRIREGIVRTREQTMTFANIQQIAIRQGPVQRLLGIADVEVRTAGGGGGSSENQSGDDMHRGFFRGIDDAESIRDTIRARVDAVRDSRPGPVPTRTPEGETSAGGVTALDAGRDLLAAVRELRAAAGS